MVCLFVCLARVSREGIASELLQHGQKTAKQLKFAAIYLETNLEGLYEKFGFEMMGETSDPFGEKAKIYKKVL